MSSVNFETSPIIYSTVAPAKTGTTWIIYPAIAIPSVLFIIIVAYAVVLYLKKRDKQQQNHRLSDRASMSMPTSTSINTARNKDLYTNNTPVYTPNDASQFYEDPVTPLPPIGSSMIINRLELNDAKEYKTDTETSDTSFRRRIVREIEKKSTQSELLRRALGHIDGILNSKDEIVRMDDVQMLAANVSEIQAFELWLSEIGVVYVQYLKQFLMHGYDSLEYVKDISNIQDLVDVGICDEEHQNKLMEAIVALNRGMYDKYKSFSVIIEAGPGAADVRDVDSKCTESKLVTPSEREGVVPVFARTTAGNDSCTFVSSQNEGTPMF